MRLMRNIRDWLVRLRDEADVAFMAAAYAQAGEPGLAREIMFRARNERNCCRAVSEQVPCHRPTRERCAPALTRGW